ncbi:MAG: DUF11 domain-containing protein, partial [Burkholderiaceae bacterium]|nr:DUF11 domain-containing protein [Burkholderiaceae bacterium]
MLLFDAKNGLIRELIFIFLNITMIFVMVWLSKIDLRICGQNIDMLKIVSSALFCGAKDGLSRNRPSPSWRSSGLSKAWRTSASFLSLVVVTGLALFGAGDARAQAAACVGGETLQTFDFPAAPAWIGGSLGPYTFAVGAVNLTFQIVGSQPFTNGSPTQGTIGNIPNTVRADHTTAGTNVLLSTQNLSFNRPVNKLRFISEDVDSNVFQDVITTRVNGTVIPTLMTPGSANIAINAATGTATAVLNASQCGTADATCNVTSNFNTSGITSASQQFLTGPSHSIARQYVGWNRFSWCLPALANLGITKTDGVASVNAGASTTYTIVLSNAGPSPANGATLADPVAAGLTKTAVSCSYAGGAIGPLAPTVAQMEAGFAVTTLPNGGSATCSVTATVTATSGSVANTATAT